MWTNQLYWYHDKIDRTKTHRTSQNTEYTKTQQTIRNNLFLWCFCFFLFIFHLDVQNTNGPYRNPRNITKTQYSKTKQTFRNQYFCCCFFRVFSYCLVRMKIIQTTCWVSQPFVQILCTLTNCKISAHIMHLCMLNNDLSEQGSIE